MSDCTLVTEWSGAKHIKLFLKTSPMRSQWKTRSVDVILERSTVPSCKNKTSACIFKVDGPVQVEKRHGTVTGLQPHYTWAIV